MSEQLLLSSSIIAVLAISIPFLFLATSKLGTRNKGPHAKNMAYESGVTKPIGGSDNPFSVKFYLVALLFVLFDVEIIFMLPWAVNVRSLGLFGLVEMFIFMILLLAGLIYIYKAKALTWQ